MQHPFIAHTKHNSNSSNNAFALHEYLLLIEPTAAVTDAVTTIKKQFAATYNCKEIIYSKPHITLVNFLQYPINNYKIALLIEKVATITHPILIQLNGFGSFPAHTIYANIVTKTAIVEMVKQLHILQRFTTLHKFTKGHFITEPHITIARNLLPWQYEQAWLQYQHQHFNTAFTANTIVLLSKPAEEGSKYTLIKKFTLQGKPSIQPIQAPLF